MDGVYQITGHSFGNPEQFSLQPSASQGMNEGLLFEIWKFFGNH